MSLKLITEPTVEPVSLAEAKLQARIDGTDEDDLITALIVVARQQVEHELERALITQTWTRTLDAFPCSEIELGMPPVQSTGMSISYVDTAGDTQTVGSSDYVLDTSVGPGFILPAYGKVWPATLDTAAAVTVTFICGFGATADDVPAAIRQWIKVRVAELYKFREATAAGANVAALAHVDRMLDRYRWYG